jgi:glucose-6-phosphate 1-dehydrogenase
MAKEILPQAAVIYGASGDLTKRKLLPAFWHLWLQRRLPKGFALVGYARSAMTTEEFRQSTFDDVREVSRTRPRVTPGTSSRGACRTTRASSWSPAR